MTPVYVRSSPIGYARTAAKAVRLAIAFADPASRALIKAGWRLVAIRRPSGFHITLKG